jgi:hypothetical protein
MKGRVLKKGTKYAKTDTREHGALVSRHKSLDSSATWTRFVKSPNARHSLSNTCASHSPASSCDAWRDVAMRDEMTGIMGL